MARHRPGWPARGISCCVMTPWSTNESLLRTWSCWCAGNTSTMRLIVATALFVWSVANSAVATINRIVDVFPAHQQDQVRNKLSFVLQGVITQQLMPRAGQPGRCLAMEILVPTAAVRNLIRENKIHQIYGSMQVGQDKHGMLTLNQSLMNLYLRRFISLEQALLQSNEADELNGMIEQRAKQGGLGEQQQRGQPLPR